MNKFLSVIFVLLFCVVITVPCTSNAQDNDPVNSVLDSAEKFFLALKDKKFNAAWNLLSKKSQATIINDVYKESHKIGARTTKEDIRKDFDNSGIIFKNYWNAFLDTFDPGMILEKSQWEIAFIKEDKAEITITYKKSAEPARLKIFREDNAWKIGLVETFWTRKL